MTAAFLDHVQLASEIERLERHLQSLRAALGETSSEGLYVLTCRAGRYELALPVRDVIEVVMVPELSSLPDAPFWFAGSMNLRGLAVPVLDAAARFERRARQFELSDYVIICNAEGCLVGLIVQGLGELTSIPPQSVALVAPKSEIAQFVSGIVARGAQQVCIVDVRLLAFASNLPTQS